MGILGPLEYVGNEGTFPGCQGCVLRTQVEKAGEEQLLQLPGLWPARATVPFSDVDKTGKGGSAVGETHPSVQGTWV